MFYGLNGPPEIDEELMSSDSRKRGKMCLCKVYVFVCWGVRVRVCACPSVPVAAHVCVTNELK